MTDDRRRTTVIGHRSSVNTTGGTTGGESELTEAQSKVVQIIKGNNKVTVKDIAFELKINISAVQKHIEKLKVKGIIERIGPAFGGRWKVSVTDDNLRPEIIQRDDRKPIHRV